MQQFYTPSLLPDSNTYLFDEQESKHIARVLRKNSGESIRLTNGKGHLFWGILEVLNPKTCSVNITRSDFVAPSNVQVHMAVAPTKNMDRFEWFLEKATELGVHRITPILCERSERKQLNMERCTKIISAAVKQSLRAYAPILDALTPLKDFSTDAPVCCIAHCEDLPKIALKKVLNNSPKSCVLVGPEGDFTPKEIEWALAQKMQAVHLGDARLRTETAALVALHTATLLHTS